LLDRVPIRTRRRAPLPFLAAAAAVAAALVGPTPARGEDPCAADAKEFCGDVRVGSGRVKECLRQNEARLSEACRTVRSAADERFRSLVEAFGRDCRSDIDRLCSEVKPGGGRVVACLMRQQDDASTECRSELERVESASDKISTMREACRSDLERLCAGVPFETGPLIDCLRTNRDALSEACRSVDPQTALASSEIVDTINSLKTGARGQEAMQVLQGIESVAFSRSQVLFQVDSYEGLGSRANANRLLFNPEVVFGEQGQFAVQLKVPVLAVYPYSASAPAVTGLGAVTSAFTWAFQGSPHVHQYLSAGLQWISPDRPPVGAGWAVLPGYAISVVPLRWFAVTGQVAWWRSFASSGYPEIDLLVLEPIVVLNLPGRSFVSADFRLGKNFVDGSWLPVIKGIAGLYLDRRKSLSISAWYQTLLSAQSEPSTDPGALSFRFGVGTALAYFFDW
jgi:hypothetical protein